MSQPRPFPVDTRLTGISLAYQNRALIADSVLPRVPVGNQSFKWLNWNKAERFTVPNTLIGRKGRPNEVEFGATETPGITYDYGLDDVVPNDDIASAPQGWDPLGQATEGLTDLIALDREVRVASLVMATGTYPAANKDTLSGTSQWSDYTNSNPVLTILEYLSTPLMRPNVAVMSQKVWNTLRAHPKVVSAILGNSGQNGIVSRMAVAQLFELEEILVGEAFVNTAKPGQTAVYGRCWDDNCAFITRNRLANTRSSQMTFGYTAQWQGRVAGQMADPETGLRGAVRVRVGESVNEIVCASDTGFLVIDPIA
jgi:hypothetical protein